MESERRPLVSVVTVTFNAREALEVTLGSVRSQSWNDWEHLVVDGASTDGTAEVAMGAMAADERIRAWSEPDHGIYDAMNKGLERARGEYVIFLNAGDTFHDSETLERIAREALYGRPDTIYGQTRLVSGVKERIDAGERHLRAPRCLGWRSLKWGMLVCHQAMAVRRDLAPKYDLTYRFSADYDWMIKCLKGGRGDNRYIDGWLIDYLDEGVTTANHKASLKERYRIMCRHYGRVGTIGRHGWFFVRNIAHKFLKKK